MSSAAVVIGTSRVNLYYILKNILIYTVDSRYLEVKGTLWNTSRYPYFNISDLQNWGKCQSNNKISQMNMQSDSFS